MGKIKVVLWDVDGTLLDFDVAEKTALRRCFAQLELGNCTEEMLEVYKQINQVFWQRLERGELTKPQVLEGRFYEFFARYGLDRDKVPEFNRQYQMALGDTFCFHSNGKETVAALRDHVKQYAVTNGSLVAQKRKLAGSGLDKMLDGIFISDEVGAEKPSVAFFEKVWDAIGTYGPDEVVIVGDSLTSDMRGGNNAGILTCWFDPEGKPVPDDLRINWHIRDLAELPAICGIE